MSFRYPPLKIVCFGLSCGLALGSASACTIATKSSPSDDSSSSPTGDTASNGTTTQPQAPVNSPFAAKRAPDERAQHSGLKAPIEIIRDEFGVPHVYGAYRSDVAYAHGYLHAQDRLFLMDIMRRLGTGTIAEYLGQRGLEIDIRYRTIFMSENGENVADVMAQKLSPELRSVAEAYAAGVNRYLKELREGKWKLPPSYQNPGLAHLKASDIPDWKVRDSFAVARFQEYDLTYGSGQGDLARGELIQKLSPDLFSDLVRFAPPDSTVVLPEWYKKSAKRSKDKTRPFDYAQTQKRYQKYNLAEARQKVAAPMSAGAMQRHRGSNNWVIAGKHTQNGFPIVANDPHLPFVAPASFYNVHLNTEFYQKSGKPGLNTMGVSTPGGLGIVIGQNSHVAWGATVAGWDVTDVYMEKLNEAGDAVLFNGNMVPIARHNAQFRVGTGPKAQVVQQVIEYVPHHGPVVQKSMANKTALTVKWTGRIPHVENGAIEAINLAKSIPDWMEGLKFITILAQNWNGADTQGRQGYFPHAAIPIRKSHTGNCAPYKPMDGTGACEWIGMLPPEKIPQAVDPQKGWMVTANNDIAGNLQDNDPTNDPSYLLNQRSPGFRASRITQQIEAWIAAGKKISVQDVIALQADVKSRMAERLVPLILKELEKEEARIKEMGLGAALQRLRSWDFRAMSGVAADFRDDGGPKPAEIESSIATSIFYAFLARFGANVLADDLEALDAQLGPLETLNALFYLMEHQDSSQTKLALFDDKNTPDITETPADIILRTLKEARDWLGSDKAFNNPDMNSWRWGQIHGMRITDLFGVSDEAFITYGPFPRSGGSFTVDVAPAGANPENFHFSMGPQMRYVAELRPDGPVALNSLPGGQSDDPDSPHFQDLLKLWLNNKTFPYYFKVSEVVDHMKHYRLWTP